MNLGINKKWFSTWVIIKNMECFVSNRFERQHSSPDVFNRGFVGPMGSMEVLQRSHFLKEKFPHLL